MILDQMNNLTVIQFGVGGTGSWLAKPVAKFLRNISMRFPNESIMVEYNLVDPDFVEDRNILRQNFDPQDIGRNKASTIKRSLVYTFNTIICYQHRMETKNKILNFIQGKPGNNRSLKVIFGCIDNNKVRRSIFYACKNHSYPIVYIDGGNELYHGQIVTSAFNTPMFRNNNSFKNLNFNKLFPENVVNNEDQNCAFFGDQSQAINMMCANLQFINFQQLLVNETLPPNWITFNSSGYSVFEI